MISENSKSSLHIYICICTLIAIGLVSNSTTIFENGTPYYIITYCFIVILEAILLFSNNNLQFYNTTLHILLIIVLTISNCINQTFNYRFILFISTILLTSPIIINKDLFVFKAILIKCIYRIFIIITIICFICYWIGYNGPIPKGANYNPLDFRGIVNHPMWLAPISGISTICCLFYFLYSKNKKSSISNLLLFIISIFTSIAAASRSSLLAVFFSILFLLYIKSKNIKTFIFTIIIGMCLSFIALTYKMVDTRRIESKNEYQKEVKSHSRESLWQNRYKEISDSPIWGIGFGAQGIGYEKKITRLESGGGWIAILSQTGIVGFCIVILLLKKSIWRYRTLKRLKGILLNTCILIYLVIHSIFEGYINTPGHNLCILFWLIIGFLTEAKIHFNHKLNVKRNIYKRNHSSVQCRELSRPMHRKYTISRIQQF